MFSLWKCTHCDLMNSDGNSNCEACFKKANVSSPLQNIAHQQDVLFHGFLNTETANFKKNQIPKDIIQLCFRYYKIDIKHISTLANNKQKPHILLLAKQCLENNEYFMSYNLFKALIDHNNKSGKYHYLMARLLHKWNNFEQAQIEYKYSIRYLSFKKRSKCHYHYGKLLQSQNKHNLALVQFRKAFIFDDTKSQYLFEVAYSYYNLGKYQKSEQYYCKAILMNDQNASYRYWYGILLNCTKRYDAALIQFEKALGLDPLNRMYCYQHLNLKEMADDECIRNDESVMIGTEIKFDIEKYTVRIDQINL